MTCGGTKPTSGCKCAPNRLARGGKWADRSGQLTCPGACKCATFCPTLELVLRARSGQLTCPGACKCATPQWSRIDWMKVDQSHAPEHVSWSTCPGPHASSRDPKWPAVGTSFVQHETHRDRDPGRHRLVSHDGRAEAPLPDRLLRGVVEHRARLQKDDFLHSPLPTHQRLEDYCSFHLGLARQLRVVRLRRIDLLRSLIPNHELLRIRSSGVLRRRARRRTRAPDGADRRSRVGIERPRVYGRDRFDDE